MKLFKNFKTKKQLREEIKQLEAQLIHQHRERPVFPTTQKRVEILRCSSLRGMGETEVPDRFFENEIAYNLMEQAKPYIDFQTSEEPNGEKVYRGTLYVAGDDIGWY